MLVCQAGVRLPPGWAVLVASGADVAIFKRPLGPNGDFDGLYAVGPHWCARVANLREMDDSKPDLRLDLTVSRPAHLGSQHFSKPVDGG
jgi:hypothetical protein